MQINFDVEARSQVMETGIKLNVTKTIRSPKTGMFLPREGTLVSVTENLGRTLLLVELKTGNTSTCLTTRSNSRAAMHRHRITVQVPTPAFELKVHSETVDTYEDERRKTKLPDWRIQRLVRRSAK